MPLCFGIDAPWRAFAADDEFERRVFLNKDQCVVDDRHFFIRGHIRIPILKKQDYLEFSVWSSLSEDSFCHMSDRWDALDRADDTPYFGWLCSPIRSYGSVIELPLSVQCREPGLVPIFTVTQKDHPLAIDQSNGITIAQWHKMALSLLH
ncbi:DUF2199 domain-containing protein [Asticcacaulis excentricus]